MFPALGSYSQIDKNLAATRKNLANETAAKGHVQEHRRRLPPAIHAGVVTPLKQQIKSFGCWSCAAQHSLSFLRHYCAVAQHRKEITFYFFINAVYLQRKSSEPRDIILKIHPRHHQAVLAVDSFSLSIPFNVC